MYWVTEVSDMTYRLEIHYIFVKSLHITMIVTIFAKKLCNYVEEKLPELRECCRTR